MGSGSPCGGGAVAFQPYGMARRLFNAAAGRARVAGLLALLLLAVAGRAAGAAEPVHVLAFGDSLTAGYGLAEADAFPVRLQAALAARGIAARVQNAGVSGDTTATGRARLDWALAAAPGGRPDLVILELGANDGLQGLDPARTRANLAAMLESLAARDIPVLLAGMRAPPNLGRAYGAAFDGLYADLARRYGVPLYPFFLDGVAAEARLNQDDGIHPNAAGVGEIVRRILPHVIAALEAAG